MAHAVQTMAMAHLSEVDFRAAVALRRAVFPPREPLTPQQMVDQMRQRAAEVGGDRAQIAMIRDDGRLIAIATSFPRTIAVDGQRRTVLGLASVACDPGYRGQGLGKAVVRVMFDRVDAGQYEMALFQTDDARPFYERLNCRTVPNRFVNSLGQDPQANPWWTPYTMIYPRHADWPDQALVDLLGPAY